METTIPNLSEIIDQARGGDTGAFAHIVRRYQSLVSGLLFSATGDFHKSEDLAQETFLIAWQKLDELRDAEHLATWLCTIARNLVHRSYRKPPLPTNEEAQNKSSSEQGPENELIRREQSELVWSVIGNLEEKYRETLVLYYRSGQSVREIAVATDSTEESVRQRLVRARKSLKVKLEQMIGDVLTETAPGDLFTFAVMATIGTAMLSATAQATVAATGGTTTAAVGTGGAIGGKALGAATFWTVLGPVAYVAWFLSMFIGFFWAAVRNAPTLRARRLRVHEIFWAMQYYLLFSFVVGMGFMLCGMLVIKLFRVNLMGFNFFFVIYPAAMIIVFPLQAIYRRKLRGIIENDIGLPGPRVESYSYPQVERRFFLSLITNILLYETLLLFFVCIVWMDKPGHSLNSLLGLSIATLVATLLGTVCYLLGRYFLEICRTKENFLATLPLIDKPLEHALYKSDVPPIYVDHPKQAGKMFGFILLAWIGMPLIGVWYFSLYSWDKHPIALGICVALMVGIFAVQSFFAKRARKQKYIYLESGVFFLLIPILVCVLEFIEFGSLSELFNPWTNRNIDFSGNLIHHMNKTCLFMAVLLLPINLVKWQKTRREDSDETKSGRGELIKEAIARFDAATMIDDEPAVEAKPFPRAWGWGLAIYGSVIIALLCAGVLINR